MTNYRYPNEQLILTISLGLVLGVIAFTAAATLCGSALFVLAMVVVAYLLNRAHHAALMQRAEPVTRETIPHLAMLVDQAADRLAVVNAQTFAAPGHALNAYTFGLGDPKVIVLYTGLFRALDATELQFVIGHEMGHVKLGHTWLNSLLGGMAGIPSPFGAAVLLYFAFRWWNRACEYSADRAGLLACGSLGKAISALVKIATSGQAQSRAAQQHALTQLNEQNDDVGSQLNELLSTHPLIANRIEELRKFAASDLYAQLRARM
jgi:Zn-dependent protease with chaperone function